MDSSCEGLNKSISWFYNCKKDLNYYKVVQNVLQSGTGFLLQSGTTVIAKWDRLFYYKVGKLLLQSGTGFFNTKWDNSITKRYRYYKVGQFYYKVT